MDHTSCLKTDVIIIVERFSSKKIRAEFLVQSLRGVHEVAESFQAMLDAQ